MITMRISDDAYSFSERDDANNNEWHQIRKAIDLIRQIPEYYQESIELNELLGRQKIRFAPGLHDRGQASLTGIITLGPEAIEDSLLSLAGTLIHENYHCHQNPFLKTSSFWGGVFSRCHPLQRYERPAYQASLRFLHCVSERLPEFAQDAQKEAAEIAVSFRYHYGGDLLEKPLTDCFSDAS